MKIICLNGATMSSRLVSHSPSPLDMRVSVVGSKDIPRVVQESIQLCRLLEMQNYGAVNRVSGQSSAETDDDWSSIDLVIVLGGDGSILRTARRMAYAQAPVLGVNMGTLGFLAAFPPREVPVALENLAQGQFQLVEHLLFECRIIRDGKCIKESLGLNETTIVAGPPFSMIDIVLHVDGERATTYRGDGLIVSTPIGSTAYNLSAGGPIVRKDLDAFIFTPLNPHTLTNRPVIDSSSREYELLVPRPNPGSTCVVDGVVLASLTPGDRVCVRKAIPKFILVETCSHGYYRTLREKLGWGGDMRTSSG